jgi:hypothetical protein
MGPIALFDKSFLQSISLDEAVWFDRFFLSIVCPVFYVETLADLAKEPSARGPAERTVREIANKFPEMGGTPCGFHVDLCIQDLLGFHTPMDGRIPRPGGRSVRSGTVFDQTPEEAAFHRWHEGKFDEVERVAAVEWRKELSELDLAAIAKELRALGIDGKSCKTLEEAREFAKTIVNGKDKPYTRLTLAALFFHVPPHLHPRISAAWQQSGQRTLNAFAPYAAYCMTVEVFFWIALAAGLIATERPSNRTDIAYLFYLPFCIAFVSSDKLHRRCAHLFMRPNQEFVWGIDLKAALTTVNAHFLKLPEAEREQGIVKFADSPPAGNLVADLWDRHMRRRQRAEPDEKLSPQEEAKLVKRFKEFRKQATLEATESAAADDEMISITRWVRKKRGSWWPGLFSSHVSWAF